jgi:hypothetical protein
MGDKEAVMFRFLAVLLLALVVSVPAAADPRGYRGGWGHRGWGHPHSRVYFSFGFGPFFAPYPYYYYPPPVYYAPPPVYYVPAPTVVQAPAANPYCRTFHGDATIDAKGRPFYGTACLQPDGKWYIVD